VKGWLHAKRQQQPRCKIVVAEAMAECTRVFKGISKQSIYDDVHTLPATWQAIVDNHGGFVPNELS
jgi:hypothetical protein